MGQIVLGVIAAVVLSALFGLWRRHHQDEARPVERLVVGLVAATGGGWLMGLVVFVMPTVPALDWLDIIGIFLKLAIFIAGAALALAGVRLAIAALATMRTPRD
jgi:hypothetical protein